MIARPIGASKRSSLQSAGRSICKLRTKKKVAKAMKRSESSLRQKALALGIGLGHRR
jgi:hypothetical protein